MSIGRQNLSEGLLVLPASLDTSAHFIHEMLRNVLNVFLAICHEGERPHRVALAFGTMTVRLSTAQILLAQRTGKQIFRELEPLNELELALTDLGRLRAFGTNLEFFHLMVILP